MVEVKLEKITVDGTVFAFKTARTCEGIARDFVECIKGNSHILAEALKEIEPPKDFEVKVQTNLKRRGGREVAGCMSVPNTIHINARALRRARAKAKAGKRIDVRLSWFRLFLHELGHWPYCEEDKADDWAQNWMIWAIKE